MLSKRRVISIALTVLLLIALPAGIFYLAFERYDSEQTIFTMNDSRGDDHGPGKYKYPWASIFDPKKEHFDLVKFSALSMRGNYCFDMVFPRITNPWGAPEGFSHPIIEIFLSDGTQGRTEPLKQGANVIFDAQNPWSYMIKVVSFNRTAVYTARDSEDSEGNTEGVKAGLMPDKKTLRVTVPRELLPGDPANWGYYVLVGSQDGVGPDNFRKVNASASQWNLGGGSDSDYDPNVIDLLALPGRQERMLESYNELNKTMAVISPVKGEPVKNSLWEKFLDRVINILFK